MHQAVGAHLQLLQYWVFEGQRLLGVDPQQLPLSGNQEQLVELCQWGERLCLIPFQPSVPRPVGYSPLALLRLRHPFVQVLTEQGQRGLSVGGTALALPTGSRFEVCSDCERLVFEAWQRPDEVEAVGRDEFGVYLELQVADKITQRLRYIPPTTFLMGSPADELERDTDETQHEVTLTKGYWLADTTVTQALWTAVMGNNPSDFKGKQLPVENVSWDDAQSFLQRLSVVFPSLQVRLPTEAEWECACRGGTMTPFFFGSTISTEQVNYDGNYPYAGGAKGEHRRKTVAVKTLPANAWGLYEMHGNVYEWCQDRYGDYPAGLSVDPQGLDVGGHRVLRGGSWGDEGRICRSAYRFRLTPDIRHLIVGFRFALGQVS
ncbi:MAG: formylglycine-generating enzyme family protein [Thiofilum sp.]|nr:formylglycine-generating enzyme family protein [Thiofilum sp.]